MRTLVLLLALMPFGALAEFTVSDAWSRATPPGMPMGAVFLAIRNDTGEDIEIVAIATPRARGAEIHESVEVDGMMRMREVKPFVVRASRSRQLKPGGEHVMLMGLNNPLVEGETFELSMTDSQGQKIVVPVQVGDFGQMQHPGMPLD